MSEKHYLYGLRRDEGLGYIPAFPVPPGVHIHVEREGDLERALGRRRRFFRVIAEGPAKREGWKAGGWSAFDLKARTPEPPERVETLLEMVARTAVEAYEREYLKSGAGQWPLISK